MHWAIVCRGLAQASLATTAGGWGCATPASMPRRDMPSSVLATQPLCQQLDPDYLPLLPAGDPCPAASPSTTSVVPGSGQGSDFSFNRSWPWSGGLPSPFPAAAARVVATAQSATIACGRWSLVPPDRRRLSSTPKSKNLVFSHPTQKTEVLLEDGGHAGPGRRPADVRHAAGVPGPNSRQRPTCCG